MVGSPYLPYLSDTELIERFYEVGDWKDLPQMTLMYYAVKLVRIRSRMYANMLTAPQPTQYVLQSVVNKIDQCLKNIKEQTTPRINFSEIKVPNVSDYSNPIVNLLNLFINNGYDKTRAIKMVAIELDTAPKIIENFLKEHNIEILDSLDKDSDAFRAGVTAGSNKSVDSDLSSVLEESKRLGFSEDKEMLNFLKGFSTSNPTVDFSINKMFTVQNGLDRMFSTNDPQQRGKIVSELCAQLDKF